ncbi:MULTISPECIES: hypothetical protein [unclassified Streptomyces]|uniref:hypothetical protein n=1 Tax=unclassified Streptomyces TaxID=2593676 RepID=UPI000AFF474E|nr:MULTISPECIES: hypothetical protein [unclassified Streptomyces]
MEPRGYRMVVSTRQDFVTTSAHVERQLYAWLESKRYDTSALDEGRNDIAPNVTLDQDSSSGQHGAYTRWRMRETPSPQIGTWQSTLVVRADLQDDQRRTWIQVDIENRPSLPGRFPTPANTPGIARLLLDALDAGDGLAEVKAKPTFIEPEDVPEVIEELCDTERRLPIVVASVPYGVDADGWAEGTVEQAFKHLPGLATLYVLSPEAQPAFNEVLGFHPVFGGGIRTYLPGVDPAWKPDAQRHPVMSRRAIEADIRKAGKILAALPQRQAQRHPLPEALASLPILRTRPRPQTHGSEVERLTSDNTTLREMLDEAGESEIAQAKRISDLNSDLDAADLTADQLRGENEELYDQFQAAQRQVRFLQERLTEAGQYELAYAAPVAPDITYPETFSDLLDRFGELPYLSFTGKEKTTRDLDSQSVDNWLQVAWDGLLALNHFAEVSAKGEASGDFLSWCKGEKSRSYPFPAAKVAMRESDRVAQDEKMRKQRMLPVPEEVEEKGVVFMQAHLKIGLGNTVAPRLHFYDDTPRTGVVYVGYLGPHLRNTRT